VSAAPDLEQLAPGAVVASFRLGALVHDGGAARLWAVSRIHLTRPARAVAEPALPLLMKLPRNVAGADPVAIVGFETEQQILPLLRGPHVPAFVAAGDFTRLPYLVMERLPGTHLGHRQPELPWPVADVIDLGIRVAEALHTLHQQQVVHLDIKPSNVMFRDDSTAVLVDYGLARHARQPDLLAAEFTLPVGSGPYLAPEQIGQRQYEPRSDLFALGVMLYHGLTGHLPFGAPTDLRGLRRRLTTAPPLIEPLRPDCPPWLQACILRCLAVAPAQRPASALALVDELHRAGAVAAEAPDATPLPQTPPAPLLMAAVDAEHLDTRLALQLREQVLRVLRGEPGAQLACVAVMQVAHSGADAHPDADGHSRHVRLLAALQRWAAPIASALGLDASRLHCHVLQAPDAADALVAFAERNHVHQIVMGARAASRLRRFLGSVSSQVVARCPCTVTVVRVGPQG